MLGTFVVVTVHGGDVARLERAVEAAFAEIAQVDALMSLHRPDSELARVNATAEQEAVTVSPELFHVLGGARRISGATGGAFDVTIRPVADLWGFIWKEHRMPNAGELALALKSVGWEGVELDSGARSVRFARAGLSIDLGGIAKGYAVDRAVERLRAEGVTNAMVRAGGDLRVSGAPPSRDHWDVQLEDPAGRGRRVRLRLRDAAVSTSGNYENFFVVDGRRYSHILDPRTGRPVGGVAACTVIAPTCLESDAYATGIFVLGPGPALSRLGESVAFRLTPADAVTGRAAGPVVESPRWPRP